MTGIIKRLVTKLSKWPAVVIATLIFGIFVGAVLPAQKRSVEAYTGDAGSLDMSFFSTPDRIYRIAAGYGATGRSRYIRDRLTFDVVWPLVYTLFYISCIGFSLLHVHGNKKAVHLLAGASLLPLILDFLENALAVAIMASFPTRLPLIPWLLTCVTPAKWSAICFVSLLFVYGTLALVFTAIKRRLIGGRDLGRNPGSDGKS